MKKIYLVLAIAGFIAPNILVAKVSVETGNILLWAKPAETIAGMYANDISTAFMIDLLWVVTVFFFWTYREAKRHNMKTPWLIWILTLLFGMAGPFPLFLYMMDGRGSRN